MASIKKLMVELLDEDVAGFRNFMRMDPAMFQDLLQCLNKETRHMVLEGP